MMKPLIGLLLAATMATPLVAQTAENPRNERRMEQYRQQAASNQARSDRRAERQAARQQRQGNEAAQPAQRAERQAARQQRQAARQQRQALAGNQQNAGNREANREQRQAQRAQRRDRTPSTTGWTGPTNDPRLRDDMQRYERQARENALRNGTRQQRREYRQEDRREYRQDRRDYRRDARQDRRDWNRTWNRGWRNDNRYDWQRYRYANRNLYRPGRYYAPYRNHSYSRFSIGLTLGSAFLGSNYWINDPYQYRLPPAYAGTRWVRYYDDVLLVDVYTGEVVDVIHDFFW